MTDEWIQGQDSFDPIPTCSDFGTLGKLQTNEEEIRNKEFKFKITWRTNTTSNPGTRQGQETFHQNTRGLPEDKRYPVLHKEAPALKKLLKVMKTSLGDIVTRTAISYNGDGSVKETINLITQYQLASLEHLKRQAYWRYIGLLLLVGE